jgi:hypothetical protein
MTRLFPPKSHARVIDTKAPATRPGTLEVDNEIELTAINLLLTDRASSLALAYAADDALQAPTVSSPGYVRAFPQRTRATQRAAHRGVSCLPMS